MSATAAAPAGRHRVGTPSIPRRLVSVTGWLLLAVAAATLLLTTVAPRVMHYRMATMLTGSMAPNINPGDVVLDSQEDAADIAVGQILTYRIPVEDHRVESHRVTWVGHDKDGTVLIRTRGDANTADDPWTARIETAQVWRVRAVVPFAGTVIRALRTPIVHAALVVGAPAIVIIWLLLTIWRPAPAVDRSAREQRGDDEAPTGGVGELEAPAVGGDDAVADRQAKPAAGDVAP